MLAVSSSYRMRRLTAFLDPWADPFNSGFQLTQSLIAIGRGQWFGVGLGDCVQKLFYLPEAHTDFLFAVLAEELGLVGVVLTLALFLGLVWRSFQIARLAAAAGLKFPAYLAAGFGLWIGIQAFINIGVNMGVLPTKGLTLPLMSYGRSSLHRGARLGGPAAARVSRGDAPAARLGDRAGRRMSRPILIMAGGTGGHVFPALALARLLREQSLEVIWLGTERGLESRVIPAEGIPIEWLSIGGLRGKGALAWVAAPFRLARALLQALRVMRRHRPSVVVGLGGFVTGPGGVAAWLTRRPLVIHEQNAVAGFTNRCLAPLARQVLEAFPGSFGRDVHAQRHRQPGAARHQRGAAAVGALRRPQRPDPHPRHRRQPGRGAPERGRALCAEAPVRVARLRRAPPGGERWLEAGRASLRAGRRARGRAALHRGHERGVRLGGPGDLPRRRAHRLGAGGGRRRGDPRAVPRTRSMITRPTTPSTWCARAPRC